MARVITAVREFERASVSHRILVSAIIVVSLMVLTTLAAQVRIPLPFSPVPLTLQTFAVLLAGIAGGPLLGAISQGLYVGLGAAGVPVFAGFSAGIGGATTGYLLAFPVAAWLVGMGVRSGRLWLSGVSILGATLMIYLGGTGWLWLVLGKSLPLAISVGVVPFIFGDAMKAVAAWMLTGMLRFRGR